MKTGSRKDCRKALGSRGPFYWLRYVCGAFQLSLTGLCMIFFEAIPPKSFASSFFTKHLQRHRSIVHDHH
jgi:hypothetical protein